MDRSFLTDAAVVEAARDFVCIRLATYEDADEAKFLKQVFTGRSGELENTVFCLLDSDGKTRLSRAGRGPNFAFDNARDMAAGMNRIATKNETRESHRIPVLPQLKNFRLGLNVAECDALPLIVCVADSRDDMKSLHDKLSPIVFREELSGRFAIASVTDPGELESIAGDKVEKGYLVIAPGRFGVDGEVEAGLDIDVDPEELSRQLIEFANDFQRREKDHHAHVRQGRQEGIEWQTEIPVTDPMSNRAKQRGDPGKRHRRRKK